MPARIVPDEGKPSAAIEIPLEKPLPEYDLEQIDQPGVREKILSEISKIYSGNVIWGEDLMEIPIHGPRLFKME